MTELDNNQISTQNSNIKKEDENCTIVKEVKKCGINFIK